MNYHVVTLFPEMIQDSVQNSVIGRAIRNGSISVDTVSIRAFSTNRHGRVDDYPYGGGAGMVMEAEPVYQAVQAALASCSSSRRSRVIYLTPQAEVLSQTKVEELAMEEELVLLCGHYEGVDERVLEEVVTDYISIGDYVLTGGELGALVLIDAVSRFVPGVLGNETSADFESMQDNLLEYPHYTRPELWRGKPVPPILLSGDHKKVEAWRYEQAVARTEARRPDLLARSLHVNCIWYGVEEAGEVAAQLTACMSNYGTVLNYNRNTLRRKKRQLSETDLMLLVTDDPDAARFPEKLSGSKTRTAVVLITDTSPEASADMPIAATKSEGFSEEMPANAYAESSSFQEDILADTAAESSSFQEDILADTAAESNGFSEEILPDTAAEPEAAELQNRRIDALLNVIIKKRFLPLTTMSLSAAADPDTVRRAALALRKQIDTERVR